MFVPISWSHARTRISKTRIGNYYCLIEATARATASSLPGESKQLKLFSQLPFSALSHSQLASQASSSNLLAMQLKEMDTCQFPPVAKEMDTCKFPPVGKEMNRYKSYLVASDEEEQNLPAPATCGICQFFVACLGYLVLLAILSLFCYLLYLLFSVLVWAAVSPSYPIGDVQNFHISGLNASSSSMATSITYGIVVSNPNKVGRMDYEDVSVNLEAYGVALGIGSIPSFHQGHEKTSFLSGDIHPRGSFDSDTLALLSSNPTNAPLHTDKDVKFYIKLCSQVEHRAVTVSCDLNSDVSRTSGSQVTYKHCLFNYK